MNIQLNENFNKLGQNYLFSEISQRVDRFLKDNPKQKVVSLGIGDVTLPLSPFVASQMSAAAKNLATEGGFVGYGDTQGMKALREAIANRYKERKIELDIDEIFISDGAKSDLGNLCDILGDNEALICSPVYPVYHDANVIAGRKIRILRTSEQEGFLPSPKSLPHSPFVIYLCSPNNPTGAALSFKQLQDWVDFALSCGSLIIFDAAYERFVSDTSLPHSIFEIKGARNCAIEVCSFSKSAGFTGVRCGYTVVPKALPLHRAWKRRQSTKFNGASYISQVGALAALSPQGLKENAKNIAQYMKNAQKLAKLFKRKGVFFVGGENAPYLWFKIPKNMTSWQFFDYLLSKANVVGTPGVGFGDGGEGYFRFSSFASEKDIDFAIGQLDELL